MIWVVGTDATDNAAWPSDTKLNYYTNAVGALNLVTLFLAT